MMKKSGFSFIEVLVVIAIVAVVAAIAIPGLLVAQRAANEKNRPHACQHEWHETRCQKNINVRVITNYPDGRRVEREGVEQCECPGPRDTDQREAR